ncbi:MAG: hypothetical protein IJC52_01590 [Clostridia bacterium]|nr:hypothetical protein [Clostridia bacterium]
MAKAGMITAIVAAILVVAAAVSGMSAPEQEPPRVARDVPATTAAVYAVIGEWEGKVAVYFVDGETPKTVYDTAVRTLPDTEQEKLKNGIPVFSAKELALRLEDYAE